MLRLVILISGNGSNLQALIEQQQRTPALFKICAVIANQPGVYGLVRAAQAKIPHWTVVRTAGEKKASFEARLHRAIQSYQPDYLILAGYMDILSAAFVGTYPARIINIHPSLLPAFPGLHTHERVLEAKAGIHGPTVHLVTPEVDQGPILCQAHLEVSETDTPETLKEKVQGIEHRIYPQVIVWLAEKRLKITRERGLFFDEKPLPPQGIDLTLAQDKMV